MRKLALVSALLVCTPLLASDSDFIYISWELKRNELPQMAGKIKVREGASVSFEGADNVQVHIGARGTGEAVDVRFNFKQMDGSELLGNPPRVLAAWGKVAKVSMVTPDGGRYDLAIAPSRTETRLPPPN